MKQTVLLEVNDVRCLGMRIIVQETLGDVIVQKIISVSTNQTRHTQVADLGGQEYRQMGSRWQNSNPVASQFRADPKPKITERKRPEAAVDPLSERTKRRLITAEGGNFKRLSSAMTNGGRTLSTESTSISSVSSTTSVAGLSVGVTIEHQRFGIGKVLNLEGSGENAKATVEFRNAGTKQLLLKFAKFKIIG